MLCVTCKLTAVVKRGDACKTCAPSASRRARVREGKMAGTLEQWASAGLVPLYTLWNRRNPGADPVQNGLYRVDFVFDVQHRVVAVEFDERMHSDRDRRCELVRMGRVTLGYGGRPVHWVRFNPDAFSVGGVNRRTGAKEREAVLLRVLQEALGGADEGFAISIHYVCYDNDASSGLVQTHRFKTVEDYCVWVDTVAPV